MPSPLLAAENLSCAVGGRSLFDDLNLVAERGDLIEVRGPNGSGKSTLLRCLAGLFAAERGVVRRRGAVAYVGHKSGVCERMTALENLRWLARLRGPDARGADPHAALADTGLGVARHDLCGELSAGQVRRVALARLPLGGADAWLLDEPLAALDDAGARMLRGLVRAHRAAGGAVVCATHGALVARDGDGVGEDALPAARTVCLGS